MGSTATQELIEARVDRPIANSIAVANGGLAISNMGEAMEFAKLMAVSQTAVPSHCRNNPGLCLAICVQAMEWRMSPFAVANKSYVVNDRVAYESQLIHAVIEQRAPITSRLRHSFSGSGDTRKCKVWATVRGEEEPLAYESPEINKITPKNSPLWKTKPDLQLYYNTTRDWARMYFPDVIMGVYADDELPVVQSMVTRPRTLEQLSAALIEGPKPPVEVVAEETTVEEPPPPTQPAAYTSDALDQLAVDLQNAKQPAEVEALRKLFVASDPDEDAVRHTLCDQRAAELKKGGGK